MADRTTIDPHRDEVIDVRGPRRADGVAKPEDGRSIGELVRELSGEASTLVREEIALAKTEMREKVSVYQKSLGSIGLGAGLLLASLLLLMAAVNRGLTVLLEGLVGVETALWLAPLILAVLAGVIGYGMVRSALEAIRREGVTPHDTIQTLKDDKDMVARKVKS